MILMGIKSGVSILLLIIGTWDIGHGLGPDRLGTGISSSRVGDNVHPHRTEDVTCHPKMEKTTPLSVEWSEGNTFVISNTYIRIRQV